MINEAAVSNLSISHLLSNVFVTMCKIMVSYRLLPDIISTLITKIQNALYVYTLFNAARCLSQI